MNQTDLRRQNRIHIQQTIGKVLAGLEAVLDKLAADIARPAPPVVVARRQLANSLHLCQRCANRRCRRVQSCQGEPLHCLHAIVPSLPPDTLAGILRKQPARRRRRA